MLLTYYAPAAAASECAKLVFNSVCLGGDQNTLPADVPRPAGGSGNVTLAQSKPVLVELRNGTIVAVRRAEPPGSWLNYVEWRNKLIRIYGIGEDLSDFPPSANSRSSRLNAIKLGKGKAHTNWEQDGWRVGILWDNAEHVTLRYELHDTSPGPSGNEGL